MTTRIASGIAILLIVALAPWFARAEHIEELYSVGSAGRLHEAAGVFVPVFDETGSRTHESVFLLNGGYPPELDAEPIADVWILDSEFWQHLSTSAPAMAGHSLVATSDGRAYALGGVGEDDWLRPLTTMTSFEVRRIHGRLEVVIEEISVSGPAPESCFGSTAVTIDGGRSILLVGGVCLGNPLSPEPSQLWEYRIDTNRWARRADLPLDVSNHSVAAARDSLWVFGGTGSNGLSNEIYRYDVVSDSWTQIGVVGDRPGPRRNHRAVAVGDSMLVFGGIEEPFFPETVDEIWQFDLDSLTWINTTALSTGLASMAIDVIPASVSRSLRTEILIYGGVIDAWSFPFDLSDGTLIFTSDVRVPRERAEGPSPVFVER